MTEILFSASRTLMDDDKQAIVVGLGAGLGGFAGIVRIFISVSNREIISYIVSFRSFLAASAGISCAARKFIRKTQ